MTCPASPPCRRPAPGCCTKGHGCWRATTWRAATMKTAGRRCAAARSSGRAGPLPDMQWRTETHASMVCVCQHCLHAACTCAGLPAGRCGSRSALAARLLPAPLARPGRLRVLQVCARLLALTCCSPKEADLRCEHAAGLYYCSRTHLNTSRERQFAPTWWLCLSLLSPLPCPRLSQPPPGDHSAGWLGECGPHPRCPRSRHIDH